MLGCAWCLDSVRYCEKRQFPCTDAGRKKRRERRCMCAPGDLFSTLPLHQRGAVVVVHQQSFLMGTVRPVFLRFFFNSLDIRVVFFCLFFVSFSSAVSP